MNPDDEFAAFVAAYQDMVFATAVRLLGNDAEAEDIAQTVFLRAFQRFAVIGSSPAAGGWLKTVTRNLCLNHLSRYRARWRLFSEMDDRGSADGRFAATLAARPSTAPDLESDRQHAQLERALRALPSRQRVPLVLFHFEEMDYQAIATALGVSLGKVKTDIHRGREALRRSLGHDVAPR
jgi:RNA polymerase sigma-70 factor (ECF subfamily)